MAWWKAYGLFDDPMQNHPVPSDSPSLLVYTAPILELQAYLRVPRKRGGIYLLNGGYGSGKTTILNSLVTLLPQGAQQSLAIHDFSQYKSMDELVHLFKDRLGPQVSAALKAGARPVLAFDQLHNSDGELAKAFFREKQMAFEKWKENGALLVFAGDERFARLTRSGGPLGAIFDAEFVIPPLEVELASELLRKRMEACLERGPLEFPFTAEAIETLLKNSAGNPRRLVDDAREALRFAARQPPPIRIVRSDILSATAELTDAALQRIRAEFRSPAVNNALARLPRVLRQPRGDQRIHELARLLDRSLAAPTQTLEEICEGMPDLRLKPEIIVATAHEVGLTTTRKVNRKLKYGSLLEDVHALSTSAFNALAAIRDEHGLLPSQYLDRVAADTTIADAAPMGDLQFADLKQLRDGAASERAQNFLARAMKDFGVLTGKLGNDEAKLLQVIDSAAKGVALESLNDSHPLLIENVINVAKLGNIAVDDGQLSAHLDKLGELRGLWENHGVLWTEDQWTAARSSAKAVLTVLLEVALDRRNAALRKPGNSGSQDDMSAVIQETQRALRRLGLAEGGELADELPILLAEVSFPKSLAGSDYRTTVRRALDFLDQLAYQKTVHQTKAWMRSALAGVLKRILKGSDNEQQFDDAIATAARIVGDLGEQSPVLLGGRAEPGSLAMSIQSRLRIEQGRKAFGDAESLRSSAENHGLWEGQLRAQIIKARSAKNESEYVDASLVIWYLVRNRVSHTFGSLGLRAYRQDLAATLIVALGELASGAMSGMAATVIGLARVRERLTSDSISLDTVHGRQVAICRPTVSDGEIVLTKRMESPPDEGHHVLVVQKTLGDKDLIHASKDWISTLPEPHRTGITALRNWADLVEPDLVSNRQRFFAFRACFHFDGRTPIGFYGLSGEPAAVRLQPPFPDPDARSWVNSLAEREAYFVGGVRRTENALAIVPLYEVESLTHLRTLARQFNLSLDGRCLPPLDRF